MTDKTIPELSIVILCYRSGESILDFARQTKQLISTLTDSFEIVLVGNYFENSDDRTKDYISQLEKEDAVYRGICLPKEGMMGWDMRKGLEHSRGEYICVMDGDGQFPIDSISRCFEKIKEGGYGLVKTYRTTRGDGLYRTVISKIYNTLFKILFPHIRAKDINSKPKILTRECYSKLNLKSDDWFIDAEIMINIGKQGVKIAELPVEFEKLAGRQSFVKPSAIIEFLKNLFKYRFK
ncbi:glycosyltransferase family 2 protein [Jiulongibacter sediminis]|jgi:glycosyltransferase involved in cell wall biosynthesis|uniref:glycosyltransferase family 2 protein n=1 Tax=Jiulongibacter sediminis TaxID=1605367 RepID=UPI0026F1FFC3|nr:glycosyltransferase family 2 protein [Jiulongibacter sediminis]